MANSDCNYRQAIQGGIRGWFLLREALAVAQEMPAMDDTMIVLHLHLTQAELSSLLMAQINQTRHNRLTQGRDSPVTRTDLDVLEKLVEAQRAAALGVLAD